MLDQRIGVMQTNLSPNGKNKATFSSLIKDARRTKIRIGKKTYNVIHFRAGILATDTDSAELNYYEELGVFNS